MKKKTNTENPFDFSIKSPKGISSRWETLGLVKKTKAKSGPFVSRLRPSGSGIADRPVAEKIERKPSPEIPIQEKNGVFYFQPRIGGRFGKRLEISASLAKKLAL